MDCPTCKRAGYERVLYVPSLPEDVADSECRYCAQPSKNWTYVPSRDSFECKCRGCSVFAVYVPKESR